MPIDLNEKNPWIVVQEFCDDVTGVCVRVQKLELTRPRYSIEVGRKLPDKFSRYFSPYLRTERGGVTVSKLDAGLIPDLIDEAERWIESDVNRR